MDSELASEIELDLPPEYCRYRDEGCELANSCLDCPFSQCIYDLPGGRQRWLKKQRDREIVRLFITEGKRVKELALMFGISQRTVQRALKGRLGIEKTVDWERMPAAVAALSPKGYRGQRVDASPEQILAAAKHLADHYLKADKPLPDNLAALA